MDDIRSAHAAVAALIQAGWQPFLYYSAYYGSHYGADWWKEFLFRPEVDISEWEGATFGHGSRRDGPEAVEFRRWLDTLSPQQYLCGEETGTDEYTGRPCRSDLGIEM